uniref:Uncharacterized protein n=1 Tax=Anguilla anguilla TaxID=7936 RepID=A0A0E9QBF4_ANGAN
MVALSPLVKNCLLAPGKYFNSLIPIVDLSLLPSHDVLSSTFF